MRIELTSEEPIEGSETKYFKPYRGKLAYYNPCTGKWSYDEFGSKDEFIPIEK